jgi:hypothetical protein
LVIPIEKITSALVQNIVSIKNKMDNQPKKEEELYFTLRYLLGEGFDEAAQGKLFPHATCGYLGPRSKDQLDELKEFIENHQGIKGDIVITGIKFVGPKKNLLAYTVELQGEKWIDFMHALWNKFGKLEPWQEEAGLSKGLFNDPKFDDKSEYRQIYHIPIGYADIVGLQADMGSRFTGGTIDIKPLGKYDPVACFQF